MNNKIKLPLFLISLFIIGCIQMSAQIGEMKFPEGKVQHVVRANEIKWKPCPSNLPEGCEMAILEGNPKSNDLFTVRFKLSGKFVMPPHTHPKDERVTILQGNAYVAFGKDVTKEDAKEFGTGDYYVNARESIHTVWTDDNTIIQITGIGPWEANFIQE